jgi:radical SAM superfamily enzyme YgiQ (UPF0313 family)
MSKRIVFVKIGLPSNMVIAPLGIMYLADYLKRHGYHPEIFHLTSENYLDSLPNIITPRPLFVGFSVFTGNAMVENVTLSKKIKEVDPSIPIVWGNAHPSMVPEGTLKESFVDVVVFGEGEEKVLELAQVCEGKRSIAEVEGIGYKEVTSELKFTAKRKFEKNLGRFSVGWELVDMTKYIQPELAYPEKFKRNIHYPSSRGCVYDCSFCYNKVFNDKRWRGHSVEHVVKDIEGLKDTYHIDSIRFIDDCFFLDRKRGFAIVEKIKLSYAAEGKVEYIDEDFAKKLNDTGCYEIMFGMESGSNSVLKSIGKTGTVEDSIKAAEILSKYSINIYAAFIFAMPVDTPQSHKETLNLIVRLLEINPNIRFTTGYYLPFPGTEMFKQVVTMGFAPPARTEDWKVFDRWSDSLELTWASWISKEDVERIRYDIIFLESLVKNKKTWWFNFFKSRFLKNQSVLVKRYDKRIIETLVMLNQNRILRRLITR